MSTGKAAGRLGQDARLRGSSAQSGTAFARTREGAGRDDHRSRLLVIKGQRIAIPLNTTVEPTGTLRIILKDDDRIEVHYAI